MSTRNQLEVAELSRYNCRDRYEDLALHAKQATHQLQLMLAEYQMLEERCIDELQVILRKNVVFESSCLANEQYEAQMIFKVIEEVDKDSDLEKFIKRHRRPFPGMDAYNVMQALGVSSVPLPVPPPPLGTEQLVSDPTSIDPSYPVITTCDLPNLSSPAPSVVPASAVLRLLLASRPPPQSVPLPETPDGEQPFVLGKANAKSNTDITMIELEEAEPIEAIPTDDGGVEYSL